MCEMSCVPIKHGNPEVEFHGAKRSRKKEETPGELHKESKKRRFCIYCNADTPLYRPNGKAWNRAVDRGRDGAALPQGNTDSIRKISCQRA